MNYLRTVVDGLDPRLLQNQLFATTDDFAQFGAATAGVYLLADAGGLTPRDDEIHLRNNYTALFVQDDWRAVRQADAQSRPALGLRLGVRGQEELLAACGRLLVGHAEYRRAREFRPLLRSVPPGAGAQRPGLRRHRSENCPVPGVSARVLRIAVIRVQHCVAERSPGRLLFQQPGRQPDRRADRRQRYALSLPGATVHSRSSAWIGSTTWSRPAARRFRPTR